MKRDKTVNNLTERLCTNAKSTVPIVDVFYLQAKLLPGRHNLYGNSLEFQVKIQVRKNIFEIYGERWNCSESKWIDLYCILFIVLQKCKKQSCSIGQQGSRADTSDNVLLFDAIFLNNGDFWGQVWLLELKKSLNLSLREGEGEFGIWGKNLFQV